jgi:uncharacterized surface protein with fasciclin (FAS1) repeats
MKHLFASCAVIALMAAPALAQSTYDPAAPIPDAEVMPEETLPEDTTGTDEYAVPVQEEPESADDAVTTAIDDADTTSEVISEEEDTAAAADPAVEAEMVAQTEAEPVEAPIDVAELPQEYSTADLNALMLAQLNESAVEIAEMEFEGETVQTADAATTTMDTYAQTDANPAPGSELAMTESVSPETTVTEDYASTETESTAQAETYAATEAPADVPVTEDYAATTEAAPAETPMSDYAATETVPDETATMADDATVTPEAYASVEPGAQDNAAPPYDGAVELSEETGTSVMVAEQTDETALSAEGDIDQTAVEIAAADGRFSTLVELVGLAGLEEALNAEGPYTIFAPTNDAFAALPESTLTHLKTEEGKAELTEILKSHVAEGAVLASDVPLAGQEVQTLGDAALNVTGSVDGSLNVEGSATIGDGVYASNGVVYAIDAVILPEADAPVVANDTEG